MAGLAAALEPALDGGHRNREDPRDLLPGHPAVDRREHPDPQVLRVGFHVRRLAGGSILMHTAVGSMFLTDAVDPFRTVSKKRFTQIVDSTGPREGLWKLLGVHVRSPQFCHNPRCCIIPI